MWKADPEQIKVLDVHTFEEYMLIGHAEDGDERSPCLPLLQMGCQKGKLFDYDQYRFHCSNTGALQVGCADTSWRMCRSGGRSAMAVNALAKAGFTKVYNIIDGFEGDKVEDPEKHPPRKENSQWLEELRSMDIQTRPQAGLASICGRTRNTQQNSGSVISISVFCQF